MRLQFNQRLKRMKFVTVRTSAGAARAGLLTDQGIIDLAKASNGELPADMLSLIDQFDHYTPIITGLLDAGPDYALTDVTLLAPLPNPRSFRDYVAFEQHMLNAGKTFGHAVAPVWYEMPIFYFTNHQAISGTGQEIARPPHCRKLDYELEMACIIGKQGANIKAGEAEDYIFGYTIFNDWSARDIQGKEMGMPLGPHKGKDFANTIGPCLVTKDEMRQYRTDNDRFDVRMTAKINGQLICDGNFKTIHYTFGQMIERASENGVTLYPGDILGSGTVGWGSLIETNFAAHRPLEPGDEVEFEIQGIGILKNNVV